MAEKEEIKLPPELQRMSDLIKAKDKETRQEAVRDTLNELEEWFACNMPMLSKQLEYSVGFQELKRRLSTQ